MSAAQKLQDKLKLILEGEPPYDIYIRWKPVEEQPLGWDPDDPEPVARAIGFLLSDYAQGITGEILHVDGGLSAGR